MAKTKVQKANLYAPKPKKGKGRAKKKRNKHDSSKPYNSQGRA